MSLPARRASPERHEQLVARQVLRGKDHLHDFLLRKK
jgi:hypothetical protein